MAVHTELVGGQQSDLEDWNVLLSLEPDKQVSQKRATSTTLTLQSEHREAATTHTHNPVKQPTETREEKQLHCQREAVWEPILTTLVHRGVLLGMLDQLQQAFIQDEVPIFDTARRWVDRQTSA